MLLFYKFKSKTFQIGSDMHSYNTRQRHEHRQSQHRLELAASLPQNIGPKLLNRLPDHIKQATDLNSFKKLLKRYLVEETCYSVEEFMGSN